MTLGSPLDIFLAASRDEALNRRLELAIADADGQAT